jgi:hypothetical protein
MNLRFAKFHRLCAVLLSLSLVAAGTKENVDPKKGRVTTNPTSGNRYTIEQEIQIGRQNVPEVERELMADIEQANPDLQIANSPIAFTLHNRQARKLDWFGKSSVQENGQPMRERVRLIATPGRSNVVLYTVFVAPDADFEGLQPTFERVLYSLQVR